MINHKLAISLLLVYGAAAHAAPAPVTDVNDSSLERRIDTIERVLESRTDMQHRLQQQIDDLESNVQEMRGTLELHNHQLEKVLERQRELYLEIDRRIASVNTSSPTAPSVGATTVNPGQSITSGAGGQSPATSLSESDAYDKAVNLILRDKQYDLAIPEFQSFLQAYPNSSYAPNAHYWLGQLLFNKQEWASAGDQFETLVNRYPDSSKRADAMFKLGVVEQRRDNLSKAKQLFQQVMTEYPDSASSRLADARLKAMN